MIVYGGAKSDLSIGVGGIMNTDQLDWFLTVYHQYVKIWCLWHVWWEEGTDLS